MEARREFLTLSKQKRLAYIDFGPSDAAPLLLLHGAHGSARYFADLPGMKGYQGHRLIGVDRPGYGKSEMWVHGYSEFAHALEELCQHLDLKRVSVVGVSAGGALSLACGTVFPERIDRIVALSAIAPLRPELRAHINPSNRSVYQMARRFPRINRANSRFIAWLSREHMERFMEFSKKKFSPADRREVDRPEVRRTLVCSAKEAYAFGKGRGLAQDILNQATPWDFELRQVTPKTHLWGSEQDTSAPLAMAKYLHEHLPNSELHVVPDAGHLWHICNFEQILRRSFA